MLFYAFLAETVRFVFKKKTYPESIAVVFLAVAVSYAIHPNFPNNLLAFYLNGILVPLHAIKGVLRAGGELLPLTTKQLLLSYPIAVLGLLFLLFLAVFARPRVKFATQALYAYAAVFFLLSFLSHRFLMHGYPFIILFLASYISDYFQDKTGPKPYRENKTLAAVSIVMLCLLALLLGFRTYKSVRSYSGVFKARNTHFEQVGRWMNENIPAGELIFHSAWDDSSYFFGLNPKNDYFAVLHPIYMYWGAPGIYNLYRNISAGRTEDPYALLRDVFKAKYGYVRKSHDLIHQIKEDSRFKVLYEDEFGVVFELN